MADRIAVYCSTRNGYEHMVTAAKSLIAHDGADHVFFLTEDDNFPLPIPQDMITCLNVSNQPWFDPSGPNYNTKWTYMVLMRAALSKVFPNIDRILSLDTDTIVTHNIDDLWKTDISGYYLAAVREFFPNRKDYGKPYFNFGVALMNLANLRNDGTDDRIIHDINTVQHDYNEQDAINLCCEGRILPLPEEYNAMPSFPGMDPPIPEGSEKIRHFLFVKPVEIHALYRKYRTMSWDKVLAKRQKIISERSE